MRENGTRLATVYTQPRWRGQTGLSNHAPANAVDEWPDGKDHELGFLPITMAWIIVIKGRRRRKYHLIGCSTSEVAIARGSTDSHTTRQSKRRLRSEPHPITTYQAPPPVKIRVMQ